MKNLLIIVPCIGPGGKHVARGALVEADDKDTYNLIAAGRALDFSTKEAKDVKAEIEAESKPVAAAKK